MTEINIAQLTMVFAVTGTDKGSFMKAACDLAVTHESSSVMTVKAWRHGSSWVTEEVLERMAKIVPGWDGSFDDFGIACLAPVVAVALAKGPGVSIYELPELGLHPSIQIELGDLFIEASSERTQLIETHNEQILLRVLRRIREGKFSPDRLAVVYVHPDGRHERLLVNAEGEFIDLWPHGFFDERYAEIF